MNGNDEYNISIKCENKSYLYIGGTYTIGDGFYDVDDQKQIFTVWDNMYSSGFDDVHEIIKFLAENNLINEEGQYINVSAVQILKILERLQAL